MAKKSSLSIEVAKVMGAKLLGIPHINLSKKIDQDSITNLPNLHQLIKETQEYIRKERQKILQEYPHLGKKIKSY